MRLFLMLNSDFGFNALQEPEHSLPFDALGAFERGLALMHSLKKPIHRCSLDQRSGAPELVVVLAAVAAIAPATVTSLVLAENAVVLAQAR